MPRCRQRSSFRFSIANDAGDNQIGVIECRTIGVAERIPEFAPFMNASWRFRRDMAGNPSGKAELFKQPLQPFVILTDIRIDFAIGPFQVGMRDQ